VKGSIFGRPCETYPKQVFQKINEELYISISYRWRGS